MATKSWESYGNTVVYNSEIYSEDTDTWLREVEAPRSPKPSIQEANQVFNALFAIEQSKDSGMVKLSIEHLSPYVAKQWVDWLIEDINLIMKARDKQEAQRSIEYLEYQIIQTNLVEHKTLLYHLIEEQAKTLMFAEVRDEYVFKTIDPALVPEVKAKPKRALLVVLGTVFGGILAILIVLMRYFATKSQSTL
jgi:LPS O-antigen subunit length determinant protein (WzzB/FepE family)